MIPDLILSITLDPLYFLSFEVYFFIQVVNTGL